MYLNVLERKNNIFINKKEVEKLMLYLLKDWDSFVYKKIIPEATKQWDIIISFYILVAWN